MQAKSWEVEVLKRIVLFLLSLVVWLLLTWPCHAQQILIGLVLSVLIAVLFGHSFVDEPLKIFNPRRWIYAIIYIPIFIWEMTKANFDVAYRVIWPTRPIEPGIVKVKTKIRSDMGKTFLANSITLTPGTLTVDIKNEYLYIHWIKVRNRNIEEASKIIIGRFEPYLIKIFD